MSAYVQLAKSEKPLLLLTSGSNLDQSGNSYSLSNNNLQLTGQPIIYGNSNSFYIDSTHGVEILSNPLIFVPGRSLEFVAVFNQPAEEFCILKDEFNNGLYIDSRGITFRFGAGAELVTDVFLPIQVWENKHYVVLTFSESAVSLSLDDATSSATHELTPSTDLISLQSEDTETYLLDGFGVYSSVSSKISLLNDPGPGHEQYSMVKDGHQTLLNNPYSFIDILTLSDLEFDEEESFYYFSYKVSPEVDDSLILIKTNYAETVKYQIDFQTEDTFEKEIMLDVTDKFVLDLNFSIRPADDFFVHIEYIQDATIDRNTPVVIEPDGLLYIGDHREFSLLNCYPGNKLHGSILNGTNIISPAATMEFIFKPLDLSVKTVLLSQTGLEVSFGATGLISGATVYLNDTLVTDLSLVLPGQWNHIVIIPDVTQDVFVINSTAQELDLLGLTIYDTELDVETINTLYEIAAGISDLSVSDGPFTVTDNDFADVYSYVWSIVGAGGV